MRMLYLHLTEIEVICELRFYNNYLHTLISAFWLAKNMSIYPEQVKLVVQKVKLVVQKVKLTVQKVKFPVQNLKLKMID